MHLINWRAEYRKSELGHRGCRPVMPCDTDVIMTSLSIQIGMRLNTMHGVVMLMELYQHALCISIELYM